jgi:hypothetical protein
MFCPKCGKEYGKDIYVCAKCRVSLIPELILDPTKESPELAEFEEILFTPNPGELAIVKSLLDSEGIEYHFRGEFFSSEHRFVQPARLMVRTDQAEEVEEILESLNITYNVR